MKFPMMATPPLSVSSSMPSPPNRLIASPSIRLLPASIDPLNNAHVQPDARRIGTVQLDLQDGVQGPERRQRVLDGCRAANSRRSWSSR